MAEPKEKPLVFSGASHDEIMSLPREVRYVFGYAFLLAQQGGKHRDAKPLAGFGGGSVVEMVEDFDGNTFRAVYTLKFEDAVYVLHAFQKKSRKGISTPKSNIDLILDSVSNRPKNKVKGIRRLSEMKTITKSSGNVFRDLGLPDADNLLIKARMVSRIAELIDRRGLSQDEAATLAGLDQPKISALLHGRFEGYTIDRLIRILNALGQDVRMSLNSKPKERARGNFTVA